MNMKLIGIALSILLLSACSSSQEDLLPSSEQTMLDLWHNRSGQSTLTQSRAGNIRSIDPPKGISHTEMESYTRTVANET